MSVSGSAVTLAIETKSGFNYAIPSQPYNKNWVAEVGSVYQSMWIGGKTKQAPGVPIPKPVPPPSFLPWSHTHAKGADGLSAAGGTIGSAKAKEVFNAIMGAVRSHEAAEATTASDSDGTINHNHTVSGVGSAASLKTAINNAVDGVSGIIRGAEGSALQIMLDAIADSVILDLGNAATSSVSDSGAGTHIHDLQ